MLLTNEVLNELDASLRNVDAQNLTPELATVRAARVLELLKAAPQNRALFLTLAALALSGARGCEPRH